MRGPSRAFAAGRPRAAALARLNPAVEALRQAFDHIEDMGRSDWDNVRYAIRGGLRYLFIAARTNTLWDEEHRRIAPSVPRSRVNFLD